MQISERDMTHSLWFHYVKVIGRKTGLAPAWLPRLSAGGSWPVPEIQPAAF